MPHLCERVFMSFGADAAVGGGRDPVPSAYASVAHAADQRPASSPEPGCLLAWPWHRSRPLRFVDTMSAIGTKRTFRRPAINVRFRRQRTSTRHAAMCANNPKRTSLEAVTHLLAPPVAQALPASAPTSSPTPSIRLHRAQA